MEWKLPNQLWCQSSPRPFFTLHSQLPDLQMAIAIEMKESEEISGEGKSIWAEALFLEALRFFF